MIKENVLEMIGKTSLVHLKRISELYNNNIYIKVEGENPFGSVKDRVSLKMIEDAEKKGKINKNTTIIEATSGNTGIGLAGVCLYKGLKLIIVMPESASVERIKIMKAYKAIVYLTPKEKGMQGSIDKVKELTKDMTDYFIPSQFENESNVLAHYETTAREIDEELDNIYAICAGIGTGGTITGIGKYFKEKNRKTLIIGAEPKESPVINKGEKGLHGIEGIGAGFIPKILDLNVVDKVFMVSTSDAKKSCDELLRKEAFFIGFSSGAAFGAVKQLISSTRCKNENIVILSPDSGIKYLSKMDV